MIIKDLDAVCRSNSAAFKNLYKDPLSGHDTISHLFVYGTAVMAFLADLGDFHQCVFSQLQAGAHRQFPEFDAFGGNVFGKITWIDVKTLLPNLGNAFKSQKTDLAMPITGMGVVFQAVVFNKAAQKYVCFFDAFFETYRYGNNPTIGGLFMMCHFFFFSSSKSKFLLGSFAKWAVWITTLRTIPAKATVAQKRQFLFTNMLS